MAFRRFKSAFESCYYWPLLAGGYGLTFLPWSFFPPVIMFTLLAWFACYRLKLLPSKLHFTDIRLSKFRELLKLASDFFVINVGNQLLEASQLMIVSRTMGLTAAAVWSVSTKLFNLLFQLIAKVENSAVVFFSEMMAREELDRLRSSFSQMYQLTGGLAVTGMIGAATLNPYFVTVWAGPDSLWSPINNWLIAALLILNLLLRCHTDLAMHTKKIGILRFLFFFESVTFVAAALWAAPRFGFSGILIAALGGAFLFRFAYAIARTASYFDIPAKAVAIQWIAFLWLPGAAMGVFALTMPLILNHVLSPFGRFSIAAAMVALATTAIFCSIGVPASIRRLAYDRMRNFLTSSSGRAGQ